MVKKITICNCCRNVTMWYVPRGKEGFVYGTCFQEITGQLTQHQKKLVAWLRMSRGSSLDRARTSNFSSRRRYIHAHSVNDDSADKQATSWDVRQQGDRL